MRAHNIAVLSLYVKQLNASFMILVVLQINRVIIVINAINFFSRLTQLKKLIAIKKKKNNLLTFVSSDLSRL